MQPAKQLIVSLDLQTLQLLDADGLQATFPVSTALKGMGSRPGSHRTPTGKFRICERFGDGLHPQTIFRSRVPDGLWDGCSTDEDLILSRILWLDGLEDTNRNTRERFIYIHGTNHVGNLGLPASCGCVRMEPQDMVRVFDMVRDDTSVEILPATRQRGKLCFIDCDSTLSAIEGIDELARARGPETFTRVEALTHAAMNGEIPIAEVFPRRMEMIQPDRSLCERVAEHYIDAMVPGADGLISDLTRDGWTPVILSGGFAPLILPLARHLGVEHVEAVPIHFHEDGSYAGYDADFPTTRNLGKNEIIREWKSAMLPLRVVMIGDGISDWETKPDVDLFVGFGGVVQRGKVRDGSDFWLTNMLDRRPLLHAMEATGR